MGGGTGWSAEHIVVLVQRASELRFESLAPPREDLHRLGVEVHPPCRVACLAAALMQLVGNRDERPADRQVGAGQVEILPPQPKQFAATHAGVRRQPEGRK